MTRIAAALFIICMFLVTACQGKNIDKIYGSWEEIKQPREVLDFEHTDKDGNPTVKLEPEKGTVITFGAKYSKENDTTLETQYKEKGDGIITVFFNGQEYLYVRLVDTDNIIISPKGNPQATMKLKRINTIQ